MQLESIRNEGELFAQVDFEALQHADIPETAKAWQRAVTQTLGSISYRRFCYVAAIVSLYGVLERLVESYIAAYVSHLNKQTKKFSGLPEPLQRNHNQLSVRLLSLGMERRYHRELDVKSMLANVSKCLEDSPDYRLNSEAFCYFVSNCNTQQIMNSLSNLGVRFSAAALCATQAFRAHSRAKSSRAHVAPTESEGSLWLERFVDQLVQRRNEVAHGDLPDEIESPDLLLDRADALITLNECLAEIFIAAACDVDIREGGAHACGNPIKVYKKHIVGLELRSVRVRPGDVLIARLPDGPLPYRAGPILSIQVDNAAYDDWYSDEVRNVGLRMAFHAKRNYEYFIVSRQDADSVGTAS